jgi:hypothetical protein
VVHRGPAESCRRRCRPSGVTGPALRRGDWNVVRRFADRRLAIMTPPDRTAGGRRDRRRVCAVIRRRRAGE